MSTFLFFSQSFLENYAKFDQCCRRGLEKRVPTSAFARKGKKPSLVEEEMDKAGIYVWDGNDYALAVTEGLGLKDSGGMVRAGPVHYNTVEEIHKLGEALGRIATNKG